MLIRATLPGDARAVAGLIDSVARERRFLAGTAGFSEEATASFIEFVANSKGVHLIALWDGAVVGWCDITPLSFEGMTHVGRLGMGVAHDFRGRGIGRLLLTTAVNQAFSNGLERVELEVFRSNEKAIRLYEASGFVREGMKVAARKLDGLTDDLLLFAAFKPASALR